MTLSRAEKLDKIFGTPLFAVLLAIFCNVLWGCAFPFIKMGYRLFEIDPSNTASIFCFAGVRFMLGSLLVLLGSTLLQSRMPTFPKGKVFAECCVLGLWQTTTQYAFYYIAVAMLTGAFGGILNSTQSFLGVIFAHFIYGNADRMTPAKTLGCAIGFAGEGTIEVKGTPADMPADAVDQMVYDLLQAFSTPVSLADQRREKIAAVMARGGAKGIPRNMSRDEAAVLLAQLAATGNFSFSPSGKAITAEITPEDIRTKLG